MKALGLVARQIAASALLLGCLASEEAREAESRTKDVSLAEVAATSTVKLEGSARSVTVSIDTPASDAACPRIGDDVHVIVDGAELSSESRGGASAEHLGGQGCSGERDDGRDPNEIVGWSCTGLVFQGAAWTEGGTHEVRVTDGSAAWTIHVDVVQGSATLLSPSDGVLRLNETARVALTPPTWASCTPSSYRILSLASRPPH